MNRTINGKVYSMSISLYWGSDKTDVTSQSLDGLNSEILDAEHIEQLDIISSLTVPFFYGSFVYSDNRSNSKLINLIDMPLIHGRITFCAVNGTDVPGYNDIPKPIGKEYFVEDVFITGVETHDDQDSSCIMVRFNFASEDILKFTANLSGLSTFDKSKSDKETEKVNDVIKDLFGAAKLNDKFDLESFDANSSNKIRYICSSNDTLLSSLEYVYRKIFDDNFKTSKDCSYIRVIYNHSTHKYQQWKYDDVGTDALLSDSDSEYEKMMRDTVTVDLGTPTEPKCGGGRLVLNNSGSDMDSLENFEKVRFVDYDYKSNKFEGTEYDMLYKMIVKHDDDFDSNTVTRASIINDKGDKFKDTDYLREFTTSNQNGSIYDIITDSIFNNNFYRLEANGSIGRKAGDEVFVKFGNAVMSMYENLKGDYLITAIDNRYVARGKDGNPSFTSIMDLHRPFVASDASKRKDTY